MKDEFLKLVSKSAGLQLSLFFAKFLTAVALARLLGPSGYGSYVFAMAVMGLLSIPVQAGMPQLVVKEVSTYFADDDFARIRGLLRQSAQFVLLASALSLIAVVAATTFLADYIDAVDRWHLILAILLMPVIAMLRIVGASIRGLQSITLGQFFEAALRPIIFLACVLAFTFAVYKGHFTALQAMTIHLLAAMAALGAAMVFRRRLVRGKLGGSNRIYETKKWLRSLVPLSIIAGLQLIVSNTDIIMIRAIRSPEDVAYFKVALQGALAVFFMNQAVIMVVGPRIAHLYRQKKHDEVQRILVGSARLTFGVALPLTVVVAAFREPIVAALFGHSYLPATIALVILCFGRVLRASMGAVDVLLNMTGWARLVALTATIAALSNIALNALLIPRFGIEGAAMASIAALVIWYAALTLEARRRLGFTSFVLSPNYSRAGTMHRKPNPVE